MSEKCDAPTILMTKDYGTFRRLEGNREVTAKRSAKICKSISEIGLVPVPIVVNERMEVIDGQGRLDACEALGLPVYYIIHPGLGIEACVQMNVNSTSWTILDYVRSFAEIGNENYKRLLRLFDTHDVSLNVVVCAATGVMSTSSPNIRTGNLILPQERFSDIDAMLTWVDQFVPICKENAVKNAGQIYLALCFCYQCPEVCNERMLEAFAKYTDKMRSATSIKEIIDYLTQIYNHGLKAQNKVYITTEYHRYMDGLYPWYAAKWGVADEQKNEG